MGEAKEGQQERPNSSAFSAFAHMSGEENRTCQGEPLIKEGGQIIFNIVLLLAPDGAERILNTIQELRNPVPPSIVELHFQY